MGSNLVGCVAREKCREFQLAMGTIGVGHENTFFYFLVVFSTFCREFQLATGTTRVGHWPHETILLFIFYILPSVF